MQIIYDNLLLEFINKDYARKKFKTDEMKMKGGRQ